MNLFEKSGMFTVIIGAALTLAGWISFALTASSYSNSNSSLFRGMGIGGIVIMCAAACCFFLGLLIEFDEKKIKAKAPGQK
jgi:cell division protein FtsX